MATRKPKEEKVYYIREPSYLIIKGKSKIFLVSENELDKSTERAYQDAKKRSMEKYGFTGSMGDLA